MFETNKINRMIRQFRKNHPQHSSTALRYTVIPKGQHLITVPNDDLPKYNFGEAYAVVPTRSPIVYGPALVITDETDKHLAIFPL
jgi:hypothetical protein